MSLLYLTPTFNILKLKDTFIFFFTEKRVLVFFC